MARATTLPSRARTSSRYNNSCGVRFLYLALNFMVCMLPQTLGFKSGVCTTGNSLDHCDMVSA
jgi:RES domain-containing protein